MIKIGLLPMYVKLYDDLSPQRRDRINSFYKTILNEFTLRDVSVIDAPVCRLENEFEDAIKIFKDNNVDAIVTLHLAYSPSLESIKPFLSTEIPIVVLDTTETYDFTDCNDSDRISYNHGIHGVQDMCSMLIRNNRKFFIEAGHWKESNIIDRVRDRVLGLKIAEKMRSAKVGRVGGFFKGMGDFAVPIEIMEKEIGIKIESFDPKYISTITEQEITSEIEYDKENYNIDSIDEKIYHNATKTGLAIRKWIKEKELTALTVNFMEIIKSNGLDCMPFTECCKSMANKIGYAGEGDILTAALVGALLSAYPETTFAEMFCPDWKNNMIFFSHMGEINPNILAEKPKIIKKSFVFTDADDTMCVCGKMKAGKGVLVNIFPSENNTFTLIIAEMEAFDVLVPKALDNSVCGWLAPSYDISEFLTNYSKNGGTHHSAFVYGDAKKSIITFGEAMNWKIVEL